MNVHRLAQPFLFLLVVATWGGGAAAPTEPGAARRRVGAVPDAAHRRAVRAYGANHTYSNRHAVGGGYDVNGDGYADFAVGEETDPTRVSVYYGGPFADGTADVVHAGYQTGDEFGAAVALIPDFGGETDATRRRGAVLVGAPGTASGTGRAYVFLNDYCSVFYLSAWDLVPGDRFGESVADAGDCDGDGIDEVIIGASGRGQSFWFERLLSVPDENPCQVVWGRTAAGSGGTSVAGVGDVNGDGMDDLVIDGKVFLGPPVADWPPDITLAHGGLAAGAGDVNGDGYADIVVGASELAYLYLGGPTVDPNPDLVLLPERSSGFGCSVAGVGDVNRDGYADFAVGAYLTSSDGSGAGRVYVYFGGEVPDGSADVRLDGSRDERLGISVARAGDVFGDGFDDVVAGAPSLGSGYADLYDFKRYIVSAPGSGDTWNVGATETVTWLGAEPADVSLSVDGGATFETLRMAMGGSGSNTIAVLVPHLPTRFASLRVTPADPGVAGEGRSDSLFTIQASIDLLSFQAQASTSGQGAEITWRTDPGPEKLTGYRLDRRTTGGPWMTLVDRTKGTSCPDPSATASARYRLTAINGLGEAYLLGETTAARVVPLVAWPLPYRGGALHVSFATLGALGGLPGDATVAVFDVGGRRVRTLASGAYSAGVHEVSWDGRDESGRDVASGVYLLNVNTAGNVTTRKLLVQR